MPKIRIGFATDINLVNEQVGIGTTNPTARLDVRGQIRADNSAGSGGISTLTRYDGFLNKTQSLPNNVSIAQTTKGNLNSLSGEIVIDGEITVTEGTSLTGGRLDSLTVTGTFDLPHGGTLDREETPEKGSTRFNQDLGQLEFYTGLEWRTTASYDGSGRGRGVFGSGYTGTPAYVYTSDFVNISSTGNAQDFGILIGINYQYGACSSSIRGIFGGGGNNPSTAVTNTIEYITIASEGNSINFGDLSAIRAAVRSCSSSTRGVFGGGYGPSPFPVTNIIDYVQISTLGDAQDFGDLSAFKTGLSACSSSTRGVFGGGYASAVSVSKIDAITISSKGDAVKFGDLSARRTLGSGLSSSTRGVIGGGEVFSGSRINIIDYITISTFGNAIYFGDLTVNRAYVSSTSNLIRGIFAGGVGAGNNNRIDFITIATMGNAQDFGDLVSARYGLQALSDSHGGLGGF